MELHKLHILLFLSRTASTDISTLSLHDALPISASTAPASCSTSSTSATRQCWATPPRSGSGSFSIGSCRSEEHTSELQSQSNLVCRLLLEKKKNAKLP